MTRLTSDLINGVAESLIKRDALLRTQVGKDLQMLAFEAVGAVKRNDSEMPLVAVIPMTCGKGLIPGFSESVAQIVSHLGFRSFVTRASDVSGMAEAVRSQADIVMMADDQDFVAINMRSGMLTDNTHCTALGYVEVLRRASGSLLGRDVAVIGVGRVGSEAVSILNSQGARVHIHDVSQNRCADVCRIYPNVVVHKDAESAVASCKLIINASPAELREEWFNNDSVVSWPGVPYRLEPCPDPPRFTVVHDTLPMGVAFMVAKAYSMTSSDSETSPMKTGPMAVIY